MQIITSSSEPISNALYNLEEQRKFLRHRFESDLLRVDRAIRRLKEAQAALDPTPTGKPKEGYVSTLIPVIEREGRMTVIEMLTALRRVKGYERVTRESLEATLSSELRNLRPRLARIAPGTYALKREVDRVLHPVAA